MAGVVVGVRKATDNAAVRWASAAAAIAGLPLHLVHVWDQPVDLSVELDPDSLPDLIANATAWAIQGDVAATLLARRPELLVLGGREDRHRPSRITRACLRHSACAVVVVPDRVRRPTGRVVVAVRFGDASRTALRWAAAEADRRRAGLVVVHAWQVQPGSAVDVLHPDRAIELQRGAVNARLRSWVQKTLGNVHVDVDIEAVHGSPLDALLQFAPDADLIVLGRRPHSGVSRMLHDVLGNDLTSLAPCPVAVIPHLTSTASTPA